MLDRIRELLAARELSSTQFADTIGVSRPVVSHILSGRNKPSLEVVQKIVAAFPDLSLPWLLNGEGPMVAPVTAPLLVPKPTAPAEPIRPPSVPAAAPVPTTTAASPQKPETAPSAATVVAPDTPEPAEAPVVAPAGASAPIPKQAGPVAAAAEAAQMPLARPVNPPSVPPAGAELAQALATPGKHIRRIVIFYQDGTFADYQPETGS